LFRASGFKWVEFNEKNTDDPPTGPLPNGPLQGNGTKCTARGKYTLLLADESRQDGSLTKITQTEVEVKSMKAIRTVQAALRTRVLGSTWKPA
jgi:hypothetical protein